jgi:hypothetical protein
MVYWLSPTVHLEQPALIITRDRPILRRRSIGKVKDNFVHVTPAPVLRWIVSFNDRVRRGMKVLGRMPVRRIIAAADVTAGPADT